MKILVVGSGGREHAMVWKLAQSPRQPQLFCAPGNAGIEALATCVPTTADGVAGLKAFVEKQRIDLTVVGPEVPLALGIVDEFRKAKLKIFGPTKNAARLEASKIFSKDIMAQAKIRTAQARSFDKQTDALAYVDNMSCRWSLRPTDSPRGRVSSLRRRVSKRVTQSSILWRRQFLAKRGSTC